MADCSAATRRRKDLQEQRVPDRLSSLDASFLYLERAETPMHVGTVAIFRTPPTGFDHLRLVQLIRERIAYAPRYRQRVRSVPGYLANPVWVDDEHFDLDYHVRRSALPRPGSDEQLRELVARVQSRRLDRRRPLWEVYLVEGLDRGVGAEPDPAPSRFAIITKTHSALVDGVHALDLAQILLDARPAAPAGPDAGPDAAPAGRDAAPDASSGPPDTWRPAPEPSGLELLAGALSDAVRRPAAVLETARTNAGDLQANVGRVAGTVGEIVAATARVAARTATRPLPRGPLDVTVGEQRRFATLSTDLADYRTVRARHCTALSCTVTDVVLASVTGALREWLLARGVWVGGSMIVRALVPVSEHPPAGGTPDGPTSQVTSYLVDLPVGEPSPVVRLHQVSYAMRGHTGGGRAVDARTLAGLAGFAPPTLHSLGVRVGSGLSRRAHSLVVSNVPGPQEQRYAGGARLLESYPVVPLTAGSALSVGVTSYAGRVCYGLNADRDALPDLDTLGYGIREALAELLQSRRQHP